MPLMPKRVKHRMVQRGSRKGNAQSGNALAFGEYGLKALDRAWVKAIQIEACRVAMNRNMKRRGKVWLRIFPDKPVSKKPLETRQGKGKGAPEFWVAVVRPGTMMFEVDGVPEQLARESLRLAAAKLPIRTMFVKRHH
ncbi:MAG: 50S ribosomal protein L16 [bacterium]